MPVPLHLRSLGPVFVEQDHGAGELDAGEEICGEFVIAGGDGTKVLEFVEEALDEVALAIEHEITTARHLAVGLGRDQRRDVAPFECVNEGVGVEGLVAKHRPWIDRSSSGSAQVRSCACPA